MQDLNAHSDSSQSAKRRIMSLVRDDWTYPSIEIKTNSNYSRRDPITFRRREESPSDGDVYSSTPRRRSNADPYKFDSPDAVGTLVIERKRKRRQALEEELTWNEGFRHWTLQRDAWTGAMKGSTEKKPHGQAVTKISSNMGGRHGSDSTDGSSSWPLSQGSTGAEVSTSIDSVDSIDAIQDIWLPIFPPLIAEDNLLRARIKPSSYPTIYSKVVIQSLTPNVPIPLNHMISALVEGWKAEGNWPPQPSGPAATTDIKTGKGSSAFSRWRKEQELKGGAKSRVRRGIGAVKKVFSGSHDPIEELGIEFHEQDSEEMRGNVTLNKGLLHEE